MLLSFICRFISLVLVTNIILGCGKVNAEEQWFEKEYELNLKLYHYAKNYAGGATITSCVSSNAIWVDLPQKTTEGFNYLINKIYLGRTDQSTSNSISTQFPPESTDSSVSYNPTSTNIVNSPNEETTDSTNVSSTTENFSFEENSSDSSSIKMLTTNTSSNSALQTLTSQILNVITKKPQNPETTGRTDQFTSNSISTQFPPEFTDSSVGYNPTSTNIVYSTNEETTDPTNVSSTTENLSVDENSFGSSLIKMLTTSISSNSALHTSASPIVHGTTKMPQNPETTGRTDQFTSNSISTQFPPQSTESSVSNNHNIVSVSSEFTTSTSQTKSPTTLIDESSTTVTSTTVKPVTEQTEITNPTFPKNYFTSTTDMIEKTQSQKFNCLQLSEIVYLNEDKCEALLLKKNFILTTTECYRQGQSNSISTGANQTPIQLSNNAHISQDRLLIAVRIESDNCFTAEREPNIRYNFKYHKCPKPNNKQCSYLKFEDDRWKENITKGIVNRKHTDRFLGFTYGNREIVVFSSYKDGLIKTLLDQEIILKQSR